MHVAKQHPLAGKKNPHFRITFPQCRENTVPLELINLELGDAKYLLFAYLGRRAVTRFNTYRGLPNTSGMLTCERTDSIIYDPMAVG